MAQYVLFPGFRTHQKAREEVNSSIMGLLAGSQMAVHLLRLTEGSNQLLADVFPRIPHIKRFNLTTSAAQSILDAAEVHLGAMAVPYVLATHEDYMKSCLKLVERHNGLALHAENTNSARQHEVLQTASSCQFSPVALEQFHLIRLMRNCMIHSGGEISNALASHCSILSYGARAGWEKLTGSLPEFKTGTGKVSFSQAETVAILAVTKNLARQTNEILQRFIPRTAWGEIMMEDLDKHGPGLPKDAHERIRKVKGYARHYYSALGFSDSEIGVFNSSY